MTKGLLVSSVEGKSGKSAMIFAMAAILKERGYKVGFFKPFGTSPEYRGEEVVDGDALNTAKLIGVDDDPRQICPIVLEVPYAEFVNIANPGELRVMVRKSYETISEGKDLVLVEGSIDYKIGSSVGLGDVVISNILDLKDLLVVKYSEDFVLDRVLAAKELFGPRLEKVIFNKLSGYKRSYIDGIAGTLLKRRGMEVLGVVPRDAIIGGLFVDEIRDLLHGEYIVQPRDSMIIENIIVGAMSPNSAIEYFRKTKNAALVTGGDRSDLQIVALEIPNIRLIVLTGNLRPSKFVIERAESKNVPVLVVSEDTLTTTERLYEMFDQARIRPGIKQKRVVELFESFVNVESFLKYIEA